MKSVINGASTGYLDGWLADGWKLEDLFLWCTLLCYYGRLNRNNEKQTKTKAVLDPPGLARFPPGAVVRVWLGVAVSLGVP